MGEEKRAVNYSPLQARTFPLREDCSQNIPFWTCLGRVGEKLPKNELWDDGEAMNIYARRRGEFTSE